MSEETTKARSRWLVGKIGFWLVLSPWVVLLVTFLCAMAGVPGFG